MWAGECRYLLGAYEDGAGHRISMGLLNPMSSVFGTHQDTNLQI